VLDRTEAPVQIDFQRFQVEQLEEFVEGRGHPSIMACKWATPVVR
jgi:hypothetical protein